MEETLLDILVEEQPGYMLQASQSSVNERIEHPLTLSLFSGAGGLDIGFHKAGFKIVACVELEEIFCQTLRENVGRYSDNTCQILQRDIRDLLPEEILIDNVDFLIGGPPCQSFSAIGRRAGGAEGTMNDRGGLFEYYCRLVDYYRPKGFLFENVRGILSSNKGHDWKLIIEDFSKLGYQLAYRVLDTAGYGVPQHRERLIMVGTRSDLPPYRFPRPTHGPDSSTQTNYISALEAIADLQDPHEQPFRMNGKYGNLLAEVPPGQNYHYFTKEMGYPEPKFAWRSRFSDFLYKADPHKPVRTIVAQLGAYSGPFHWLGRKFTLQEFKRLQTFPDDYIFAGGLNAALRQIGNSVPPLFAEQLANAVLQEIFRVDRGLELIQDNEKLSFDTRKRAKANLTRRTREKTDKSKDMFFAHSLFEDFYPIVEFAPAEPEYPQPIFTSEQIFHYPSLRSRKEISAPFSAEQGEIYRFYSERTGEKCSIHVSRYNEGDFSTEPLLKYLISFHHPLGDGLKVVECTLLSKFPQDIPIVWDAIEDCISRNSGYKTMMDIYGHFTEPHPIFDLDLEILTEKHTFLLRFAKKFSQFAATRQILPEKVLRELYMVSDRGDKAFDLAPTAQYLRSLRFDVRVHETNRTIPPGHFRCCYPFTLNIHKQISVTWTERPEGEVMTDINYAEWLSKAYQEAEEFVEDAEALQRYKAAHPELSHQLKALTHGENDLFGTTIAEGIETLIHNLRQSKYLFSMLITGLTEKLVHPQQDIRYTQALVYPDTIKGFSNRSTDEYQITPFLKRHNLTSCAKSGAESGRNFERPEPHTLSYGGKPRGKGTKEAYLGILHAVQVEEVDPFPCLVLLMALDLAVKQNAVYEYSQPEGLTIQEITDAVLRHYTEARGNGRARIPVLALQAAYQCLVPQLSRFKDAVLRNPPNRHTSNDKDGWIGDIQIDHLDETPFEGVEVKSGHKITGDMVRALPQKFQGYKVNRYYILSTEEEYIAKENETDVQDMVREVREKTGCEVIVNGFQRSLLYYLRMLEDTDAFLVHYTEQVQTDADMKAEHQALWAVILGELKQRT